MQNSYQLITTQTGYIQNTDGIVFKVMPEHYLKLSPWKDGEDRRVHEEDLGEYKMITYENACMIINNQFSNTVEKWEHKGKKYVANSIGENVDINERSYFISTLPSHKVFIQNSKNLLERMNTGTLSITNEDGSAEMKLIKHKGKLYYILIINKFLPRVQCFNIFGEFCEWIGIKDCKPIFNITDNKYI